MPGNMENQLASCVTAQQRHSKAKLHSNAKFELRQAGMKQWNLNHCESFENYPNGIWNYEQDLNQNVQE